MTVALSYSSKFVSYRVLSNADRDGDFAECAREIARITGPCELVELGSGSSTKTRVLLDAYNHLVPLHYLPIDECRHPGKQCAAVAGGLSLTQVHAGRTYELALEQLIPTSCPAGWFVSSVAPWAISLPKNVMSSPQITSALHLGEYFY